MRSETEVRAALRQAAARVDVQTPPTRQMMTRGRRRSRLRAVGAAASVAVLLVGAWGVGTVATRPEETKLAAPEDGAGSPQPGSDAVEAGTREARRPSVFTATTQSGSELSVGYAGDEDTATGPAPEGPPLQAGPRVVKTATIAVQVERGAFQEIFGRAQRLAAAHGGFVAEASTGGEKARSGKLVIRVPSERFEASLADLKALGAVEKEAVKGRDVTADFVDLRAHLRNWRLQERAVQRLMGEADSIDQTLRLQRELQSVRLEIEKIRGNLRVLRDRTSLGTISLAMREAGAGPQAKPEEPGTLAKAWNRAVAAAGDVVATMVVGAGYLFPILALLALAWLVFRAIRPRATA